MKVLNGNIFVHKTKYEGNSRVLLRQFCEVDQQRLKRFSKMLSIIKNLLVKLQVL